MGIPDKKNPNGRLPREVITTRNPMKNVWGVKGLKTFDPAHTPVKGSELCHPRTWFGVGPSLIITLLCHN